jgi:hypothetical protein
VLERTSAPNVRAGDDVVRAISYDRAQPLCEAIGLAAVLEALRGPNERIMTDIFRIRVVSCVSERHREGGAVVATDERVERRRVAAAGPCDQLSVGGFDRAGYADRRSTVVWHALYGNDR